MLATAEGAFKAYMNLAIAVTATRVEGMRREKSVLDENGRENISEKSESYYGNESKGGRRKEEKRKTVETGSVAAGEGRGRQVGAQHGACPTSLVVLTRHKVTSRYTQGRILRYLSY